MYGPTPTGVGFKEKSPQRETVESTPPHLPGMVGRRATWRVRLRAGPPPPPPWGRFYLRDRGGRPYWDGEGFDIQLDTQCAVFQSAYQAGRRLRRGRG